MSELLDKQTSLDVLRSFYKGSNSTFNTHDWDSVAQSWISSRAEYDLNSTDLSIMRALEEKDMMLFVPTPHKDVTYDEFIHKWKNPFKALKGMQFIAADLPFDQVKDMITLNLTWKWRDVIVLFPNPRSKTVDLYTVKNQEGLSQLHDWSNVTEKVSSVLGVISASE